MIQKAESVAPTATIRDENHRVLTENRFQPQMSTPTKVDSRKKAKMPSAASGAPKMSPTKREYAAQLVPNWNSSTIPVATPTAKVRANTLIQKRAMRLKISSPVFLYRLMKWNISQAIPMVSGGKMKWKPTVTANWILAKSTGSKDHLL